MTYAHVHDETVARDFFRAMEEIEGPQFDTPDESRERLENYFNQLEKLDDVPLPKQVAETLADMRDDLLDILQSWPEGE